MWVICCKRQKCKYKTGFYLHYHLNERSLFVIIQYILCWEGTVLCDVAACSLVEVYWCFSWIYCLHLQGRKFSQENDQKEAKKKRSACFLVTSVYLYHNEQRHIPGGITQISHRLENLKSSISLLFVVYLTISYLTLCGSRGKIILKYKLEKSSSFT